MTAAGNGLGRRPRRHGRVCELQVHGSASLVQTLLANDLVEELRVVVGGGMNDAGGMLLGRVSFQEFEKSWTGRTDADDPGASFMNDSRKYVASRTLTEVGWNNATLLEGDLAEAVTALKQEDGGDLMTTGSPTLVRSLLSAGVVDELRLLVYPVVLGVGKRLFPDGGEALTLSLAEARAFSNGVGYLRYVPAV